MKVSGVRRTESGTQRVAPRSADWDDVTDALDAPAPPPPPSIAPPSLAPLSLPPSQAPHSHAHASHAHANDVRPSPPRWQLIHEDPFARASAESDLQSVTEQYAARSATPYRELLSRLVGLEELDEREARALYKRILQHRRDLSAALGRPVHVRVAALDMVTTQPPAAVTRHDSRPIMVTSAMLERALEEATADAVTGLPQRAHFMNVLTHELKQRSLREVAVAYLDLDGFKHVNDTHGHAKGDDVLRALVRAARGALREGDILARIGGDEFAVLFVNVTPVEADAALRRLRDRFEHITAAFGTSFSAGIAIAGQGETATSVVERADSAMYRQKRARKAAAG